MNNYEHYKKQIEAIWEAGAFLAVSNGEPKRCNEISCLDCEFSGHGNCTTQMVHWLLDEHEDPSVDWSKIPMDTPILVRDGEDENWMRRHFAKYIDGKVYAWKIGFSSWTASSEYDFTEWKYAKLANPEVATIEYDDMW